MVVEETGPELSVVTRDLLGYQPDYFSRPLDMVTIGTGFVILSPKRVGKEVDLLH